MINYNYDDEKKYVNDIKKHLREYNLCFTGKKEYETVYFYALENSQVVGSIIADLSWDWVGLDEIYYENKEVLRYLISKVCVQFKNKSIGLNLRTEKQVLLNDFIEIGFLYIGVVEGSKKTLPIYYAEYANSDMSSDANYDVLCSQTPISQYNHLINNNLNDNYDPNTYTHDSQIYSVVALDDDRFVGGIEARIEEDMMHLGLLVVLEEYRGKGVGSKLMTLMEEVAAGKKVTKITLGTVEFQARLFYEKLGYQVVLTRKNMPRGFENYKMMKNLPV